MPYGFLDIAITPGVRAAQSEMGADHLWSTFGGDRRFDRFTENEKAFIAEQDSFYMASVSETGWPYVQHRGGQPGFLKVVDDRTLAFPNFRGNRQYISQGNLTTNGRVCLFLMDYARRARLKIYATGQALTPDQDPELTARFIDPDYRAKVERIFKLRLEAFDWNCSQHITPRYPEREVATAIVNLRHRIQQLEAENAELRARQADQH
ncbi:pyridoxamine 5-phosphate oxidase [Rhodospirillaceae bacterium KN72]|uniref:Pyridoxamine 5-phosphate oxidase n=1 Tax=Pacificispira spongiicola TaxID=2729598 RepID=A0A7Y0E221_9PROT|nr:pyridoxamine 5'-phosphate oxidase family protein [Pacificispira spongiicola]NMM45797.1 pyridoxamine 5-phosphate oxidase [Pacificispira spongiicola]